MHLILHGYERAKYSDLFDQLYKLRHKVFIKERGWSLPSRQGLEIDQYDTDDAVYFLTFREDGVIEGSLRLTPTMQSSLIADYFPHLIETGAPPRAPDIHEASRLILQPLKRTRLAMRAAKARLMIPLLEWCLERRLAYFQTIIDAAALTSYVEITGHTRVLGLAHPYGGGRGAPGGGECMALRWPVTKDVLADVRAYGGLAVDPAEPTQSPPLNVH